MKRLNAFLIALLLLAAPTFAFGQSGSVTFGSQDIKTIKATTAAIQADVGDPSARTNLKSLEAMLGNADAAGASIWGDLGNFVGQSNLKSLLAVLGSGWNTANKSLYTILVTDQLENATFGLQAANTEVETKTLATGAGSNATLTRLGALVRWMTDNLAQTGADSDTLETLSDQLDAELAEIQTVGVASGAGSNATLTRAGLLLRYLLDNGAMRGADGDTLKTLSDQIDGIPTVTPDAAGTLATAIAVPVADSALNVDSTDVIGNKTDTVAGDSLVALSKNAIAGIATGNNAAETASLATGAGSNATTTRAGLLLRWMVDNLANTGADGDTLKTLSDQTDGVQTGLEGGTAAVNRVAGKPQVLKVAITAASNAAPVTLATSTTKAVIIKGVTLHNVAGANADLTSINIKGGAGSVVTFIDDVAGLKANLDAADKQVFWNGSVRLPVGATMTVDPTGTGATALNMVATIEYAAEENTGYLAP